MTISQKLRQGQYQRQFLSTKQYYQLSVLKMPYLILKKEIEEEVKKNPYLKLKSSGHSHVSSGEVIEKTASKIKSFNEVLLEQLRLYYNRDSVYYYIGEEIISQLDQYGYLSIKKREEIENNYKSEGLIKKEDKNIILEVVEVIKQFDPIGSGCLNMVDYFLFNMINDGIDRDDILYKQTKNYLEISLELGDPMKVKNEMNLLDEDMTKIIGMLSKYRPYPREGYGELVKEYIVPDVIIDVKEREVSFHLNKKDFSELELLEVHGEEILFDDEGNEITPDKRKEYMMDKKLRANNLIDAMTYRDSLLKNLMKILIEKQKDFFLSQGKIQPYSVKEVAKLLEVHSSTISRIAKEKYMKGFFGVKSIRMLFARKVIGGGTKLDIEESIRQVLKELDSIDKPLSDRQISEVLFKQSGFRLATRTIAKYRKMMNIPSSRGRKR